MIRPRFLLVVGMLGWAGGMFGQPRDLVLPRTGDRPESARPLKPGDVLANYGNDRREAALAAFQAGYKAATVERKRDRATRLMLVALRRDPSLEQALYDIGILCAQYGRWDDAIGFQQEAQRRAAPGSEVARLAAAELERMQAVARLDATPEGSKRREFDIQLVAASANKDPIKALIAADGLTRRDAGRWEGFALAGMLRADSGDYGESMKTLETAASLAPAARRAQLQAAAEIARREVTFNRQVQQGDSFWEKREYEAAAKTYSEAWEASPARLEVGLRAATGYLLADQVPLAVQVLARLRAPRQPDFDAKVTAMLRALGAISEDAKNEAAQPAGAAAPPAGEPAERIRGQVGSVVTPQMELAARPDPPLVDGTKRVIPVPDDEINSGQSDIGFLSSVSLFALYQRDAGASGPASPPADAVRPPGAPAAVPAPAAPVAAPAPAPPAETPPPPAPARLMRSHPETPSGPARGVEVISRPAGAAIAFDTDDPAATPLNCIAPCQVPLAPGRHTLRAVLAGHRTALRIFEIGREPQPVVVEMDAKRSSIQIESEPAGLAVFLNGNRTGKVTPVSLVLNEGAYEVGVEMDGKLVVEKVLIEEGKMGKLRFAPQQ